MDLPMTTSNISINPRSNFARYHRAIQKLIKRSYSALKAELLHLPEYKAPDEKGLDRIEKDLRGQSIQLKDYAVAPEAFDQFMVDYHFGQHFYGGRGGVFLEKTLEHFIAYDLGLRKMETTGVYLDIAAHSSPWVRLLNAKGYRAWAIDLNAANMRDQVEAHIAMDATHTGFRDASINCVSLQCAFEMFARDGDMRLIDELARILVPGGRAVISPLYMHTEYCGYCSPEYWHRHEWHDQDARLYVRPDFLDIPFSRKYDAVELEKRVLSRILGNGMDYNLYVLRNGRVIHPEIYCRFILEIIKPGIHP